MGDFAPWKFWRCKHAKNSGFTRQHTDRLKAAIVWPKEKPSRNTTAKAVFLVDTQHMAWHEGISINPLVPLPNPAVPNFPDVFSLEILWKNSWLVIKNHPGVSKSPHHQSHSSSLREFGPASGPGIAGKRHSQRSARNWETKQRGFDGLLQLCPWSYGRWLIQPVQNVQMLFRLNRLKNLTTPNKSKTWGSPYKHKFCKVSLTSKPGTPLRMANLSVFEHPKFSHFGGWHFGSGDQLRNGLLSEESPICPAFFGLKKKGLEKTMAARPAHRNTQITVEKNPPVKKIVQPHLERLAMMMMTIEVIVWNSVGPLTWARSILLM